MEVELSSCGMELHMADRSGFSTVTCCFVSELLTLIR